MNQELLKNVIEIFSQASDLLYQENLQQAYMLIAAVLPKFEEVIMGIEEEAVQNELTAKLREALEAMEAKDNTLLADIIQYELKEQLEACLEG